MFYNFFFLWYDISGDSMKLDNFLLEEFDEFDAVHRRVISMINDVQANKYLGDLEYHIKRVYDRKKNDELHNEVYIAYYDSRPVGFISISHKDFGYEIASGILPLERGKHLGALLLQEFSEKLFELYDDIDEVMLKINPNNQSGIKAANLVGFQQNDDGLFVQKRR